MTDAPPLLWALIGPNGAGKSTYYERKLRPRLAAEFVNADRIAQERWPEDVSARAYDAAREAEARRRALIAARRSLVAETVFSHSSKLQLLRDAAHAGFLVWVTFIYLESSELSVARVAERVARGGHDVPRDKLRARYERMAPLAVEAIALADRGFVVDNSDHRRALRDVLMFERGSLTYAAPDLPAWAQRLFGKHLAASSG